MLKTTLHFLAIVIVTPLVVLDLAGKSLGAETFSSNVQLLSLIPGKSGSFLRLAYLRCVTPTCNQDAFIGFGTIFSQRETRLGRGIYIGPQCNIGACSIGDDTLIASGVHIMSGARQHGTEDLETPIRDQKGVFESVHIGRDCWIGNGALIMADVGDQCIIGAGSVVTKPVPALSVVAGNPARIIRSRGEQSSAGEVPS